MYIIFQLLQLVRVEVDWVQLPTLTSAMKNILGLVLRVCSVWYILPVSSVTTTFYRVLSKQSFR